MPVVFVISSDWRFRAGLRAELRERGIEALGMETPRDAGRTMAGGVAPSLMVWDAGSGTSGDAAAESESGMRALEIISRAVPLVVIAPRLERAPLPSNVALLLHRPARVGDVAEHVLTILQGRPA